MKTILTLLTVLISVSAHAYRDGEYICKDANGKVRVEYKVTTLDISGQRLPFLEATRHFETGDIQITSLKGLAMVAKSNGIEYVFLGNHELQFDNDVFTSCK